MPLEGRPLNFTKQITFELRSVGSYESVNDAAFIAANDQDSSIAGIQITTTSQGDYSLTEVPGGTYNLVALTDLYLSGQVSVTISANEVLTDIRPTVADDGTTDRALLFAGDADADNKIDTVDLNLVFNAFNTTSGNAAFNASADFNEDNAVNILDLSLVSGHLVGVASTVTGVSPYFKPVPEGANAYAAFALAGLPEQVKKGQTFEVTVSLNEGQNIRGYNFDVLFNPNLVAPVLASEATYLTKFLGDVPTASYLQQIDEGKVALANIHQGRPEGISGNGDVAVLTFQALADGRPGIALDGGYVIDPRDQVSGVGLTQVNGRQVLPVDFTLDGSVDLIDYAELMAAMGSSRALFDLNADGVVDDQDRAGFLTAFSGSAVSNATPVGALSLSLAQENLETNGIAKLNVQLSGVSEVRAVEFELVYDAERFEYLDALSTDALASGAAFEVRTLEPGRLMVINAFDAAQSVDGAGLVAQLQFQIVGAFNQADPFVIARGVQVDGQDLLVPVAETGTLLAVTAPTAFLLYQNHPNPFNPETHIGYDIAENVAVSLKIYNVLGQVVRTLVDEPQMMGRYTVLWDGKDQSGVPVSSGVYIYQIEAGSFKDAKRLMMLK